VLALSVIVFGVGCTHPGTDALARFLESDPAYTKLPSGPQRVDAIWAHARNETGSDVGALDLLGSIAVAEGLKLRHPFDTGLTADGVLSPNDKTGHFFSHAMWQYYDHHRLIPVAGANGVAWEVVGEIKSWFTSGAGFDWEDIWANRLGREFGRRIYHAEKIGSAPVTPSQVIAEAEAFRPKKVAAEPPP